jgi:hypothetical protein
LNKKDDYVGADAYIRPLYPRRYDEGIVPYNGYLDYSKMLKKGDYL